MDTLRSLYTILVATSAVTMIFAPFGMAFSIMCLKTVHFNLRIITISLGILWCIFPIGGFLFVFILDAEAETPQQLYAHRMYQVAKNIVAPVAYAFRMMETAACLERFLATVYFETYENSLAFHVFSIFAVIISLLISTMFSILFNFLHIHAAVIYAFLFTVETSNFIVSFLF